MTSNPCDMPLSREHAGKGTGADSDRFYCSHCGGYVCVICGRQHVENLPENCANCERQAAAEVELEEIERYHCPD